MYRMCSIHGIQNLHSHFSFPYSVPLESWIWIHAHKNFGDKLKSLVNFRWRVDESACKWRRDSSFLLWLKKNVRGEKLLFSIYTISILSHSLSFCFSSSSWLSPLPIQFFQFLSLSPSLYSSWRKNLTWELKGKSRGREKVKIRKKFLCTLFSLNPNVLSQNMEEGENAKQAIESCCLSAA